MTFLAPSALIFLVGIGVPILIHIFNRFNVKKINYSSIRFLKTLENSAIRNIKTKKLILLLIRIGIITALIFMLSRPVTEGFMPGWLSAEIDSRLFLVIDNSSSMTAKIGGITMLEDAKNTAVKILKAYGENTTVDIVQTCPPQILYSGKVATEKNRSIVNSIKFTQSYDNIWLTLDSLLNTLDNSEPLKECIVISDFQTKSDFTDSLSSEWKYYLIDVGKIENNLSINRLDILTRMKVPDQLMKIKTTINNSGISKTNNVPINLTFDENRVGQVISDFEKNINKDFIFQAYPNKKGILTGSVILPNDDYLNDNIWHMATPILSKINCLIICNSDNEYEIFKLVIDAIDPNEQLINLELRKQPVVNRLFVDETDILVVHNPAAFTEAAFNELDVFLKNGGGLIWFSGGMELDQVYRKYFSNLRFPNAIKTINIKGGKYDVLMPLDENHIFSELNIRKLKNELPEVYSYVKHVPKVKQKVHLELNNGDPFLMDFDRGNGKIFYFTSLLSLEWNDLTLRGLLIPLMYRLLILGGTDEVNSLPVSLGKTKWIMLDGKEVRSDWEVESPSGLKNLIVPDYNKEGLKITNTHELGVYRVYKNGELYTAFATELHKNEIVSMQISEAQKSVLFKGIDYRWIKTNETFINIFNEVRHGKVLWKIFLIFAIILFLLETWIGRPNLNNFKK